MKLEDKPHFAALLTAVSELHNRTLSKALMSLYWAALERYDLLEVRRALSNHALNPDNGQFMPKPADIVRILEGDTQSLALIAWSKLEKAVKSVGAYESVAFDDHLIHAVIDDMGGWVGLCHKPVKELPFLAKEFEKRYRHYLTHPVTSYPRKLVGLCEQTNGVKGLESTEPRLIGQPEKARLVYERDDQDMGCGKDVEMISFQAIKEKIKPLMALNA